MSDISFHKARLSAFTLIELLASIAVIAILGSIIYAGVGKALQASRKAELVSNMRQVHTGLMSYVTDNRNTFPKTSKNGYDPDVPGSPSLSWQQVAAPYVGEDTSSLWQTAAKIKNSVFHDPLDTSVTSSGSKRPTRNVAMNAYADSGSIGLQGRKYSSIEFPAKMLALTTGQAAEYGDEYGYGMRVRNINYSNSATREQFTRVSGEYFCVFVDGHLEVVSEERMIEEALLGPNSIFFDPAGSNGQGWPPKE